MFYAHEIQELTATSNPYNIKVRQEGRQEFAASLNEAELAQFEKLNALEEAAKNKKPTGMDWWFDLLMSDVRNQTPAASSLDLAKTENHVRRVLSMEPNPDTLFEEYFAELLGGRDPATLSEDEYQQLVDAAWAMVENTIEEWQQEKEKLREEQQIASDLAVFDKMQNSNSATVDPTQAPAEADANTILQQIQTAIDKSQQEWGLNPADELNEELPTQLSTLMAG